jgi:hypothetical protein
VQIIIGRNAGATMQLADGEVSGQHAAVRWSSVDKCWKVADLGSLNGTLLNGDPIGVAGRKRGRDYRLSTDDILQVGRRHRKGGLRGRGWWHCLAPGLWRRLMVQHGPAACRRGTWHCDVTMKPASDNQLLGFHNVFMDLGVWSTCSRLSGLSWGAAGLLHQDQGVDVPARPAGPAAVQMRQPARWAPGSALHTRRRLLPAPDGIR